MFDNFSNIAQNNIHCSMFAFLLSLILIYIDSKISREIAKQNTLLKFHY